MSSRLDKLHELLAPVVESLGYQCWGIEFLAQGRHSLLRVYIDHENGIAVEDCEAVSRQISAVLDVEDPISGEYNLEVSSPGMDRPLFNAAQFAAYVGSEVKIRLTAPLDGRRNLQGVIRAANDEAVQVIGVEGQNWYLPLVSIDKANVIPAFD
ncbi:ribosome maturation factor RimP [Ventosimonas gracilis]|uniref:Ribosome maturation factor RimP n=1 Tax=Ventosimonas gracilis TaxID=1680762 RepID=A0A139SNK9_9GAMM|nr:ribosome maturation factor RimP [Ventosimonas gracilis]KXU36138.1 ribosome maturation factor RimP [Ventosimonas gracilis]